MIRPPADQGSSESFATSSETVAAVRSCERSAFVERWTNANAIESERRASTTCLGPPAARARTSTRRRCRRSRRTIIGPASTSMLPGSVVGVRTAASTTHRKAAYFSFASRKRAFTRPIRLRTNTIAGIWNDRPSATTIVRKSARYPPASMIGVRCDSTIHARRKRSAVGNAMRYPKAPPARNRTDANSTNGTAYRRSCG